MCNESWWMWLSQDKIVVLKARSHGVMCDCDLLYQEMECCLRFSDFVPKMRWVWMRFPMYLHWNRTSQSHRMGVEPNHVRCHTHQCITRTWNRTIWTPSLTSAQSIFCITVANQKIAPCERAFNRAIICFWYVCFQKEVDASLSTDNLKWYPMYA